MNPRTGPCWASAEYLIASWKRARSCSQYAGRPLRQVLVGPMGSPTSLCSPRVLLQNVLLCFGDPVCPLLCCFIGWIVVQTKFVSLALVCSPWSKVDVRDFGQSWEVLQLAVFTCGCLNVKGQSEQRMWSPRNSPVSGQSSGAGQLMMQKSIIQDVT